MLGLNSGRMAKPRGYSYQPRFYDPEADAIGRKLAALPLGPLCRAWCGGLVWGLWGGPLRSLGLVLAS